MEVCNLSLINKYNNKPTKLETKTNAVDDRNYTSTPSVSHAYYSPSFSATIRRNDGPTVRVIPEWSYSASEHISYNSTNDTVNARKHRLIEWEDFLEEEKRYSDDEKEFVLTSMAKKCTKENYVVPPKPDKEALDTTMYRYNAAKEDETSDNFDFNFEYRKELKLKDWRKNLFSDSVKYRPYDSIQIIKRISDVEDPEDILPFDKLAFERTYAEFKDFPNKSLRYVDPEDFDFRNEYKKNLEQLEYTDDGIFCPSTTEDRYSRYLIREGFGLSQGVGVSEEDELYSSELYKSPSEMQALYRLWGIESTIDRNGNVVPKIKKRTNEEQTIPIKKEESTSTEEPENSTAQINNALRQYLLMGTTECGNNNAYGCIEDFLFSKKLKEAGINTVIDVRQGSDSIYNRDGITYIFFDTSLASDIWTTPAFVSRKLYESGWKFSPMYKNNPLLSTCSREQRVPNSNELEKFDKDSRNFIDKFVTVIEHLNKGGCVFGCTNGYQDTNQLKVLDYYFNPKSEYKYHPLSQVPRSAGRTPIMAGVVNLYRKLTPEDKKKMGWDESYDTLFMINVAQDVDKYIKDDMNKVQFQTYTL